MTVRLTEAELQDLKSRHRCDDVAGRWVKLRRHGKRMIGPCPICSAHASGADATRFEAWDDGWVCAVCADGGDVIRLVMLREGLSFVDAVAFLGGARPIDPEEAARAEKWRAEERARRDRESREFREKERRRIWQFWRDARPAAGTPAEAYLRKRGVAIPAASPPRLRFLKELAMYADGAARSQPVYRGPAMLAAIVGADGRFAGLHMTWLDLDRAGGKAAIAHPGTGEMLPAKKVRGSKAGGRIELLPRLAPRRLIIGEGIETALSLYVALEREGRDLSETAIWSCVDLGNMGGKAAETVAHPFLKTDKGRAQRVPGPVPDPEAPGLPIPDSVEEIVLLGDGDSDRFLTACAVARAAARFAREGRLIRVAWAPSGQDFNDVIRGEGGAAEILRLVDGAKPPVPPQADSQGNNGARRKARGRTSPPAAASSSPDTDTATPGLLAADTGPPSDFVAASPPPPAAAAESPPEKGASSQTGGSNGKTDGRKGAGMRATARRDRGRHGGAPPEDPDALNLRLAFFPQTDLGNAERFRERNRGRFLWCPAVGWLWWDGRRWAKAGADEKMLNAVHDCVRAIQDEADALAESERDRVVRTKKVGKGEDATEETIMLSDVLRAWGRASESHARLVPVQKQVKGYLHVEPEQLDADKFKINLLNGTLSLHRIDGGEVFVDFYDHDPEDLITKLAPVEYNADAKCPRFDQFLAEVQPAPASQRFLAQWMGLSMTGDTSEQRLCVFWGKGKNGKSVFVDACAHVAGDYSETVPIETFLAEGRGRNAGQATPDLAILPGVRMLRTSEPKRNATLDEALIKLSTGGEPIIARHLNRDYFKFYPEFKLTISGNYRPKIEGADEGIWRRVILLPWGYTVPEDKRDGKLSEKLRAEAPGILNRLVAGVRDWMENGLLIPEEASDATADYRTDSDPLGRFLEACVKQAPGQRVQASALHELFCAWAKVNAATEWSLKGLGAAMKERGFHNKHSNVMFWLDIMLVAKVSDFVDAQGRPWSSSRPDDDDGEPDPATARSMPIDDFVPL